MLVALSTELAVSKGISYYLKWRLNPFSVGERARYGRKVDVTLSGTVKE